MARPTVQSYRFGEMVVDGVVHRNDLLLLPDRVLSGWWRRSGHELLLDDLQPVLEAAPQALVVGCGANARMRVPEVTRSALAARFELVVLPTSEAWQRYNELAARRPTAGAFHLTC